MYSNSDKTLIHLNQEIVNLRCKLVVRNARNLVSPRQNVNLYS